MFVPHASEIWTKSYGPKYTKFGAFLQKKQVFYNLFWQRFDVILKRVFVVETIV